MKVRTEEKWLSMIFQAFKAGQERSLYNHFAVALARLVDGGQLNYYCGQLCRDAAVYMGTANRRTWPRLSPLLFFFPFFLFCLFNFSFLLALVHHGGVDNRAVRRW